MAATLALVLAVGSALAADDPTRTQLEQRIKLTARLYGDGANSQRIAGSGNARAITLLDEGRVHQTQAEQALAAGDLAAARREVDEALRHISLARKLVPNASARQAEAQQRYQQRLATLERLLQAWAVPAGADASASTPADGLADRQAAVRLIAAARNQAAAEQFDDANRQLAEAETHLLAGMNRLLHQRTIDYTARAATPTDAFYEALARHEGLIELVPVALSELKPGPDAITLVERYSDTSRALRQQAVQRQQRGEVQQAVADLNNALIYVQRALAAAGVALPSPTN
ncbi:MAG: hypothetical protein CFE45_18085 [Burkholderiales bacterium PBB5]|nr:MAG: hypothetical protein CFE45_18085 [Burkholderiales bacterium PBB5]